MDIPQLHQRLTDMIYRRRFEIELEELGPELSILKSASEEIQRSSKLQRVILVSSSPFFFFFICTLILERG